MCTSCDQDDCGCESIALDVINGADGAAGLNNYQLWLAAGNTGSLSDFLATLLGEDGLSAYQLAVQEGYVGTVDEWLVTLSAYGIAVANGFVGTEADWLASLQGADGSDGNNAYTLVSASFETPLVGSTVTIACAAPESYAWAGVGQPVFITQAGHYRVVTQGTLSITVENLGHSTNAAPGTTIPDPLTIAPQIQCSPDGEIGVGDQGDPGDPGADADLIVQDTIPSGTAAPGTETRIYRNTGASPYTFELYRNTGGTTWVNLGFLSGAAGARILYPGADPNTLAANYGNIGDTAIEDVTLAGSLTGWLKINNSPTWTQQFQIIGGGASGATEMYRVGKAAPQAIPIGSTDPTTVQFELWTGSGLYNGGWWNGSAYNGEVGISDPQAYILENLRIYSAATETIDFDIDILVKGVSEANATIAIVSPATEGTQVVLTTGDQTVDDTVVVKVTVTPQANPTVQWFIDFNDIVFYNQT